MLREERYPDLEVAGSAHGPPRHPAGAPAVLEPDRQKGRVAADQPVLAPAAFDVPRLVHAEAEPLVFARCLRVPEEPDELVELVFLHSPKLYRVAHLSSLAHPGVQNLQIKKVVEFGPRRVDALDD